MTVRSKDGVEIKPNVSYVKTYYERLSENTSTERGEHEDLDIETVEEHDPIEPLRATDSTTLQYAARW